MCISSELEPSIFYNFKEFAFTDGILYAPQNLHLKLLVLSTFSEVYILFIVEVLKNEVHRFDYIWI